MQEKEQNSAYFWELKVNLVPKNEIKLACSIQQNLLVPHILINARENRNSGSFLITKK
jgi:hypothetical protein